MPPARARRRGPVAPGRRRNLGSKISAKSRLDALSPGIASLRSAAPDFAALRNGPARLLGVYLWHCPQGTNCVILPSILYSCGGGCCVGQGYEAILIHDHCIFVLRPLGNIWITAAGRNRLEDPMRGCLLCNLRRLLCLFLAARYCMQWLVKAAVACSHCAIASKIETKLGLLIRETGLYKRNLEWQI